MSSPTFGLVVTAVPALVGVTGPTPVIYQVSPVMPTPTLDANGRPTGWKPTSVTVTPVGRLRFLVGGVDVTFFRGVMPQLQSLGDSEPFGDAQASVLFPQITPFDTPGSGDLTWFVEGKDFQISLIPTSGAEEILWRGYMPITNTDDGAGDGDGITAVCQGSLYSSAISMHQPMFYFDTPLDIGLIIAEELNSTTSRRFAAILPVTTGIATNQLGDRSQSRMDYVQGLLGSATRLDGSQVTVKQTPGSTVFTIGDKDITTIAATYHVGTPGLETHLTRDITQAANAIYGEWTTPGGCVGRNSKYPNLLPASAPAYPNTNPSNTITVGETDASTDSGHGVTVFLQRLSDIGYSVTVNGTYTSADSVEVKRAQAAAGILVDGIIGPQTWAAIFDVGSNGGDLTGAYFAPIAELTTVQPKLFAATGAIIGDNPAYDPNILRVERFEQLGDGITRVQAIASAQGEMNHEVTAGYTGTLVAKIDPEETWRGFVRAGQNIKLKSFKGTDLTLHVVSRSIDSDLTVTWTVDSLARDAITVASIIERNEATNADPARQYRKPSTSTITNSGAPWDCESGAGIIPKFALFSKLWSVIRIPMAEYGSVARTIIQTSSPISAFALLVFENAVSASDLVTKIGNPLATGNTWNTDATLTPWLDAQGMRMAWGSPDQQAGYSPGSYSVDADPLTGLLDDDASWDFVSSKPPWIWLAFYSLSSCFVSGQFRQSVQ